MPTTKAGKRLHADIREMAGVIHQTDSLRSHADPNDKTGWNLGPIETCEDPYCVEGRDASAAIDAIEAEAAGEAMDDIYAAVHEAVAAERARIRAAVEADLSDNPEGMHHPTPAFTTGWNRALAAVLALLEPTDDRP